MRCACLRWLQDSSTRIRWTGWRRCRAGRRKTRDLLQDLEEAFEFLTLLRIECQLRQVREGQPLSNYIAPESLTNLQRSLLREAFRASARAQAVLEETFRTAIWAQLGR